LKSTAWTGIGNVIVASMLLASAFLKVRVAETIAKPWCRSTSKRGGDKWDRMLGARDKAAGNEGVKRINRFRLRRSHGHGWCPLGVGRQVGF
jgi:hypothetical protein